jgi:hypothetical protein
MPAGNKRLSKDVRKLWGLPLTTIGAGLVSTAVTSTAGKVAGWYSPSLGDNDPAANFLGQWCENGIDGECHVSGGGRAQLKLITPS